MITSNQINKDFRVALSQLDHNKHKVLISRLFKQQKLAELGKELNLSPARIYQIEQAAWKGVEDITQVTKITYKALVANGTLKNEGVELEKEDSPSLLQEIAHLLKRVAHRNSA